MDSTRDPVSCEGTNDAPQTPQGCSRFDFTCVTETVSVVIDRSVLLLAHLHISSEPCFKRGQRDVALIRRGTRCPSSPAAVDRLDGKSPTPSGEVDGGSRRYSGKGLHDDATRAAVLYRFEQEHVSRVVSTMRHGPAARPLHRCSIPISVIRRCCIEC